VPKTKAATKFQKEAQRTARKGVSTRVETTVAMEFAASCQPLENSKARVKQIVMRTSVKLFTGSGVLENYAFDYVGDVFTLIDGSFDYLVNFLPLDNFDGILFLFE